MLAYKEWYNLFIGGKLNEVQSQFLDLENLRDCII